MKLKTLETALSNAIIDPIGVNDTEDFNNYLKARDEIIALANHCEDGLNTDCSIVSWYALSNLMNVATYDDFGKIYKEHRNCKRVVTKLYREACRDHICEELTDGQIDSVADFLTDLWLDNESCNANTTDGSFNKHPETRYYEMLMKKLWSHIQEFHADQSEDLLKMMIGLTDVDVDNLNQLI